MISKVNITKFNLPNGLTHTGTSYMVGNECLLDEDGSFLEDNRIELIENDEANLMSMSFDLDYTHTDTYYLIVKLHFSNGEYHGWTKPVVLTKDGNGFSHSNTVVCTPDVTVTTDMRNSDLGGFRIDAGEFNIFSGSGTHQYTDWKIVDSNGDVKWSKVKDRNNLTNIRVPNNVLNPNTLYVIEVVFHAGTGMRSNKGKLLLKSMGKSPIVELVEYSDKRISYEEYQDLKRAYENLLVEYGDKRISYEEYQDLKQAYEYLLAKCVDDSALR